MNTPTAQNISEGILSFVLGVTFGKQYVKITGATEGKSIVASCLRLAWNDAFRHVTRNITVPNSANKAKADEVRMMEVLSDNEMVQFFHHYAGCRSTEERVKLLKENETYFTQTFGMFKSNDDPQYSLCFGHYQKLFNMAVKLYCCVYVYRARLGIDDAVLTNYDFAGADCPIDRHILSAIDREIDEHPALKTTYQELQQEANVKRLQEIPWSKFGKEERFSTGVYLKIQKLIKSLNHENSGLLYDLEHWK